MDGSCRGLFGASPSTDFNSTDHSARRYCSIPRVASAASDIFSDSGMLSLFTIGFSDGILQAFRRFQRGLGRHVRKRMGLRIITDLRGWRHYRWRGLLITRLDRAVRVIESAGFFLVVYSPFDDDRKGTRQ